MIIIFGILLFSVLIFVHELGHFVAAKLSGVQVNEFAIFMGPAIVKWQRGETLYSIRTIPFGGYCAMEGEDEDTDNDRSFQKAAWWKRLCILVAGAFMNFVAGILLMTIVFGPTKQITDPVIAEVQEGCTIVREDGLHLGDRILEVDGEKLILANDFSMMLTLNGGDVHDLVVERDGEKVILEDFVMEKHLFGEEEVPRYGFSFGIKTLNFGEKVEYIWHSCLAVVRDVRLSLQMLLTGKAGVQDMMGPVGIVQVMSESTQQVPKFVDKLRNLLYFGAFISINLGVMNLLPIPAVDGGRVFGLLVTTAIETVTRKKVNPKVEGYIHTAGFLLLMALMVFILFKDIFFIFKR